MKPERRTTPSRASPPAAARAPPRRRPSCLQRPEDRSGPALRGQGGRNARRLASHHTSRLIAGMAVSAMAEIEQVAGRLYRAFAASERGRIELALARIEDHAVLETVLRVARRDDSVRDNLPVGRRKCLGGIRIAAFALRCDLREVVIRPGKAEIRTAGAHCRSAGDDAVVLCGAALPRQHALSAARRAPDKTGARGRLAVIAGNDRSEERRVGTEGRSRWSPYH